MLLSKLAYYLCVRNGQHLLLGANGLQDIGFNLTALWVLLEPEIDTFTGFCPPTKQFSIEVLPSNVYDFTYDPNNTYYTPIVTYSTGTLTISGSGFASGETITFGTTDGKLDSSPHNTVYTTVSGDASATALAPHLAAAINADTTVNSFLTATAAGAVITLVSTSGNATSYACASTNGSEVYTFNTPVITTIPSTPGEPPLDVTSVLPMFSTSLFSSQALVRSDYYTDYSDPNRLVTPRTYIWEYRCPPESKFPYLYTSETGFIDVKAMYKNYEKVITTNNSGIITEVEVVGIENSSLYSRSLLKILSGKFLLSLSRSRRAFTYNDLPIATDANSLVQEAQREIDEGFKELYASNKWWEAVRP